MSNLVGQLLLNRYQVNSFLGSGGMAEVYKVWDNQRSTFLAMKVLHDNLAQNPLFLEHFRQEAETLSKLEHPHIVRFYGFKQDREHSFILMDFIEGETLKTKIKNADGKIFSAKEIREILQPLFGALQFAHNQGMVHCDIKPANIMIDEKGTVLLTDFGIARAIHLDSRSLTSSGTPAYMAPEQALGEALSPQTDIYALGIVIYEMLTGGKRPFDGTQAQISGRTSERIRWEQVHSSPPPLYDWNPSLNPVLNAIVMKSLAKDTQKRYRSALDLLNALKMVKEDEGQEEPKIAPKPPKEKAVKSTPKRENKTSLWIVASLFLVAAVLIFVSLFPLPGPPPSGKTPSQPSLTQGAPPTSAAAITNTPFIQFLLRPYAQHRDADAQIFEIENWTPLTQPGHVTWNVNFPANTKAFLIFGWCATDQATLRENLSYIEDRIEIDGQDISISKFATTEAQDSSGLWCKSYHAVLSGWETGTHSYIHTQYFKKIIDDGMDTFPAGDYIMEHIITVR